LLQYFHGISSINILGSPHQRITAERNRRSIEGRVDSVGVANKKEDNNKRQLNKNMQR